MSGDLLADLDERALFAVFNQVRFYIHLKSPTMTVNLIRLHDFRARQCS